MRPFFLYSISFLGGFFMMSLEIIAGQMLQPVFGSNTNMWSAVICVFITSLSAGYFIGGYIADHNRNGAVPGVIFLLTAIYYFLIPKYSVFCLEYLVASSGNSKFGVLLASFLIFFIPSLLLGIITPVIIKLLVKDSIDYLGRLTGALYAVASLGNVSGVLITNYVLLTQFGPDMSLYWSGCILLALGVIFLWPVSLEFTNKGFSKSKARFFFSQAIRLNRRGNTFLIILVLLLWFFLASFPVNFSDAAGQALDPKVGQSKKIPSEANSKAPPEQKQAPVYAPCGKAPEDMVCVPGGMATVGSDNGRTNEKPERKIEVDTFYIDKYEISIGDYDKCETAGACKPRLNKNQGIMRPFVGAKQPMVPMDWEQASQYCAWAGKRLPTEWEWEKAARGPDGDLYPWGNDDPDCTKAQFRECAPKGCKPYKGKKHIWDCPEHATKEVGAYPAGHYGVYEMAGNGYEWTATWYAGDIKACGKNCNGKDLLGPCQGAFVCGKSKKVLKGGSWYWPKEQVRGSYRRGQHIKSGGHRLSARCATSNPYLTRFPPYALKSPPERLPAPKEPSPGELTLFTDIKEDVVEKVELCEEEKRAYRNCRDPKHYVKSNEINRYLWFPYIKNLGGGYVGIGSDQNYSFIAIARSRWAWILDYDPYIVDLHKLLKAIIIKSETPAEFVNRFSPKEKNSSLAIIKEVYPDPELHKSYQKIYKTVRAILLPYYRSQMTNKNSKDTNWLKTVEHYSYIRDLYLQGRIQSLNGNLLDKNTMIGVGEAARKLGIAIKIYYPSNAPECWALTKQYRRNVIGLPFDEFSMVLQSHSGLKTGFGQKGYWHYNIQHGLLQQKLLGLRGYDSVRNLMIPFIPTDEPDLTLCGLPSD